MTTTSTTRRRIATGSVAIGLSLVAFGAFAPNAQADTGPTEYGGNPNCAAVGFANEFKIDQINDLPAEGDYTPATANTVEVGTIPAGFTITLDNVEVVGDNAEFDWAAKADSGPWPIDAVLVKASDGGNGYTYTAPGATSDIDLVSLKDSISHISFCWNDGEDPTTGDPTTGDPTTGDPTTGDPTTTGDVSPTTGAVAPETEVKGAVVLPAQLPRTGDNDASLAIIGGALVLIGGGVLLARRNMASAS